MIAIFSDTHAAADHELEGEALAAAREADAVIHAGDFTTATVLDAFREECSRLYAVHGNADGAAVRDRLPEARTVEESGLTIAVTHRRDGGATGLAMFGRSRDADVVVSGHSHRPTVVDAGDVVLVNPGSHARPRGNRPGFATIEPTASGFEGEIREPAGELIDRFAIE